MQSIAALPAGFPAAGGWLLAAGDDRLREAPRKEHPGIAAARGPSAPTARRGVAGHGAPAARVAPRRARSASEHWPAALHASAAETRASETGAAQAGRDAAAPGRRDAKNFRGAGESAG